MRSVQGHHALLAKLAAAEFGTAFERVEQLRRTRNRSEYRTRKGHNRPSPRTRHLRGCVWQPRCSEVVATPSNVTGLKHAVTTQPCGALNAGDFEDTVGAIDLGPLVRDQSVTVCFAGEATTGSATLTVSATSSIHDPNPGNNSATK